MICHEHTRRAHMTRESKSTQWMLTFNAPWWLRTKRLALQRRMHLCDPSPTASSKHAKPLQKGCDASSFSQADPVSAVLCVQSPWAIGGPRGPSVALPQKPQAIQLRFPLGSVLLGVKDSRCVVRRGTWVAAPPPGVPLCLQ